MRAASGRLCAARPGRHADLVGDGSVTQGVFAWHTTLRFMLPHRTIYMDGRPHPSENAPHTWQGFSTGEWEGDMLKVTTDPSEGRMDSAERPSAQRQGYLDRIFYSARELLHARHRCEGPGLSDRAAHSNVELDPGPGRPVAPNYCIPSVEVPHPKGYVALPPARGEPWLTEFASRLWDTR